MRWLACVVLVAGCQQDRIRADSVIELEEETVSDLRQPRDWRLIKIFGDGTLTDERDQQATRQRHVSPLRFVELVQELKRVGFLTLRPCMMFDHGRHTTLVLTVPEGHNEIRDATTCPVLVEPIHHILELAD